MIEQYLDSKKLAWSETTKRSERARLNAVSAYLTGNPNDLWEAIKDKGPYTRLTVWTRVTQYWQWMLDEGLKNGKNEYKVWREKNAKVFKNTYVRTKPEITFDEAKRRIQALSDRDVREKAIQLLEGGLRFNESNSISDGTVLGKGGKTRRVYVSSGTSNVSYGRVYAALKRIGIRPHDLRKLFLSRVVESGANEFELCEIAGWSNLNTASSYIKVNSKRIEQLVRTAVGS